MAASVSAAPARMNGTVTPTAAEDEELYAQLLRLQDVVLAGTHPRFKLPPTAIEQLKAALIVPEAAANTSAYATNHASSTAAKVNGRPGLGAHTTLDPIFLEKSDSLVRAESQLKRQRLERDLQTQAEQRRHVRNVREPENQPLSPLAIDDVLRAAQERVKPVSGLKPAKAASLSSFDENDYYSSRAPSAWSSDASSSKGSDRGIGAFTANFERLDGARPTFAESSIAAQKRNVPTSAPSKSYRDQPHSYAHDVDVYEPGDEDDDYTPPDAAAFDNGRQGATNMGAQQGTPEDDNSDYEPGEITQESTVPTPYQPPPRAGPPSPRVPVIRNHLMHIAAPQPKRVSPLATAKGPSIELELVDGRPEIVQKPKPQQRSVPMQSRVSTASPSGPGGSNRKKRNKKRKREQEFSNRAKKRRDRHVAHSPVSPAQREPYIKDEPVSPPPFVNAPEALPYMQPTYRTQPPRVDLVSPKVDAQQRYANEPQPSGLRYEYAPPASPAAAVRVASPGAYRPVQRHTQDLRRAASMHYAQRPASPAQRIYSPVGPYRAASSTYIAPQQSRYAPEAEMSEPARYPDMPAEPRVQYIRTEPAPSPPRVQEYQDPYARAQSPAIMAPPPPRRIVVDQYGNRYYAAEPAPMPSSRASVAPVERQPEPQPVYERALSRLAVAYAPPPAVKYEPVDARMAPPPPSARRQEQAVEYVDANGYRVREYSARPVETPRYAEAPTSPVYQQMPRYEPLPMSMPPPALPAPAERTSPVYQAVPRYEAMPPPSAPPAREQTSPVCQQVSLAYSVRPQEPSQAAMSYVRQASVAPVQYVRQEMAPPPPPPPHRAVSVAPGGEHRAQTQQPAYSYAPQAVRYIDQYGREVDPQQLRQASVARY